MPQIQLIIANKKYSSWSMRPWLALKVHNIEFEERLVVLDYSTNNQHFREFSPTKKVPVMVCDGQTIWDSLAILENLAELFPQCKLWPADQKHRAHARAVSCEMHSGFTAMRSECPMNMQRRPAAVSLSAEAQADIARIETIWSDCLKKYGGPFLFGEFTIADAMYAPVVNRMHVYCLSTADAVRDYSAAITALPAWQAWEAAGIAEEWVSEVGEI